MINLPIKKLVLGIIMSIHGYAGMAYAQNSPTPEAPVLFAAGSLRAPLDEIMRAYQAQGGAAYVAKYGPSGKLRLEIEAGAAVDVFASASTDHTQELADKKLLDVSRNFTNNQLCVVAKPELKLNEGNFLNVLRNSSVRVATSTPISDPMGDYTWQFFKKADTQQAGIYKVLDAKALKLSGASVPAPGEKLPYISAFEENKADTYIMYCTNALIVKKALPQLDVLRIPDSLNVLSAYGIAAGPDSLVGKDFIQFVLSPTGQSILKKHGFN